MTNIQIINSQYQPSKVSCGIVHIGLGAFHRAHQAVYLESALNRHKGGDWAVCSANIRSNKALVDDLNAAACRYHVLEYTDSTQVTIKEIRAVAKTLFAGAEKAQLLVQLADPSTRIVTLTVTEKGYYLSPAEKKLLVDDADIQHDIQNPTNPKTAPGLLVEALRLRRLSGLPAFTVLSCDNMPDNGERVQHAVVELAAHQSQELAQWIAQKVAFPSSMVDRIVPAMTDESRQASKALLGFDDPNCVACESFSQWVVEDRFPAGRPDWELDGVEMVADVRPFEAMKLRLLNGSHSLLAYIGFLAGYETVAQAVADPAMVSMLRSYMSDEAAPTLHMPEGVDVSVYGESLITRFSNDSLQHRLEQIAMDGSQKIVQRWLQGALENLAAGRSVAVVTLGIAAWIQFASGKNLAGAAHSVHDPLAEQLAELHQKHSDVSELITAFLNLSEVFPAELASNSGFKNGLVDAFHALKQQGVAVCLDTISRPATTSGE